jgi:hypothetical protein
MGPDPVDQPQGLRSLGCITEALPDLIRLGRQGPNVAKWLKEEPDKTLACFAAADPPRGPRRALPRQARRGHLPEVGHDPRHAERCAGV